MTTDLYDLHTIDYSVQGWDAILTTDMEKLDDVIHTRILATAGETIAQYDAVYLESDGKYDKALADGSQQPAIGLALESANLDDEFRIQRIGPITDTGWSWATVSVKVYLDASTPGALTDVKPSSDTQMIGFVLSATSIFIWIDTMEWVGVAPEAHKDTHDPEDGSDALDTAAASEIVGVQAAAEGSAHSFARSDHDHQIQHGIADNHLVTIDHASIADDDYARFTANGLEGRSTAEAKTDLGFMTDLVDDTTPQLGGDLDMNGHNIGEATIGGGIAEDIDLITVDEGTADPNKPVLSWNESEDSFETNKGLVVSAGNVGIETTSPAAKLQVGDDYNVLAGISPAMILGVNQDSIQSLHLENANAGIHAEMRFIVRGDAAGYIAFTQPSSGNTGSFFGLTKSLGSFLFNTGRDLAIGTHTNYNLIFGQNNTEAMRIDTNKRLGIAETSPDTLLHLGDNTGITIGSGSDADQDLITVDVTGSPKLWWDESEDSFGINKSLTISEGLVIPSGTTPTPATAGALFLDTDAGANGTLKMYSNGAWRDVQVF